MKILVTQHLGSVISLNIEACWMIKVEHFSVSLPQFGLESAAHLHRLLS